MVRHAWIHDFQTLVENVRNSIRKIPNASDLPNRAPFRVSSGEKRGTGSRDARCTDRHSLPLSYFEGPGECEFLLILTTPPSKPLYPGAPFPDFGTISEFPHKEPPVYCFFCSTNVRISNAPRNLSLSRCSCSKIGRIDHCWANMMDPHPFWF